MSVWHRFQPKKTRLGPTGPLALLKQPAPIFPPVIRRFNRQGVLRSRLGKSGLPLRAFRYGDKRVRDLPDPVKPLTIPVVLPDFLRPNWRNAITISTDFQTDVTLSAYSLAEDRRSLAERPRRTMKVLLTGLDREDATMLVGNLLRQAHRRRVTPLYPDFSITTQTSTGLYIYCDTTKRRFFGGQRVLIHSWNGDKPVSVKFAQIAEVFPTYLQLKMLLGGSYPAGSYVYPLIDTEISLKHTAQLVTDDKVDLTLSVDEVYGDSALPAIEEGVPSGFPTHEGYPVLNLSPDWTDGIASRIVREGRGFGSGRGRIVTPLGERPQLAHKLDMRGLSRSEAWEILRFFESRRGRLLPFWVVSPQSLWTVITVSTTYIEIEPIGNQEDIEDFLPYLGIEERDGTLHIRGISNVIDQGSTWKLVLDTSLPTISLSNVVKTTSAHFVRQQRDSLTEEWKTDGVCRTLVEVLDVVNEQAVSMT